METQLATVKAERDELKSKLAELSAEHETLQAEMASVESVVEDASTEVGALTKERDELIAKLATAIPTAEQIETTIALKLKEHLAAVGVREAPKVSAVEEKPFAGLKGKALAQAALNAQFKARGLTK
jgi:predicted nuclease with TOPRIM domain